MADMQGSLMLERSVPELIRYVAGTGMTINSTQLRGSRLRRAD